MEQFVPGQRWISDAEPQLGLGTVLEVEHRTVTVAFMACDETRTYARHNAPLNRVHFSSGDKVGNRQGWNLHIESVSENDGLLIYSGRNEQGEAASMLETELDHFIQLDRPAERLFAGQVDADQWFELRYLSLQQINRLSRSNLYGLTGARTQLLPHQLYIAHEVAHRYAPRVLLADEVGLGKTIEAGLILHHQLLTERARRVLILVPETLLHQWLVEMLRRFNLHFSIYDEQRLTTTVNHSPVHNPFEEEQHILCSIGFLNRQPEYFRQCLQAQWDLLVVDEAHHLQWTPQQASNEYRMVEQLAAQTRGVLLLTATPEQLGKQGHFARLRLLDPERFPDFERFVEEEQAYRPVAEAVQILLQGDAVDENAQQVLQTTLAEPDSRHLLQQINEDPRHESARHRLIEQLLDRHGTGRVLFRNTRATVQGFPRRQLHSYPLRLPDEYRNYLARLREMGAADTQQLLCPERLYQTMNESSSDEWSRIDPRMPCLLNILKDNSQEKLLVITAHAQTALDIAQYLNHRNGIPCAVFHEKLSIMERDRAAAWFADTDNGARVMVCSEIGSEGRNFQFAHHLLLFDLPVNPDLLEQRIGRLDRIGQTGDVQIHLPWLRNSAQEILFNWYHLGLDALQHGCPAGHSVFVRLRDTLLEALHQIDAGETEIEDLIDTTRKLHGELKQTLQQGRDRLLEYNSCRPPLAEALQQEAHHHDLHNHLPEYMDKVFDCFGIDYDIYREKSLILRPGAHMGAGLPGLTESGLAVTYDRATALANEDLQFLTWEHPLVMHALDHVLSQQQGNNAVTAVNYTHADPGSLLLECVFVLQTAAVERLQSQRYLPPTPLRIIIDEQGRDHGDTLPHAFINQSQTIVDKATAGKIIDVKRPLLHAMIKHAEQHAERLTPAIRQEAHEHSESILNGEITRLRALKRFNPNIRREEIDYFSNQLQALSQILDSAVLRLDALRVIVVTD